MNMSQTKIGNKFMVLAYGNKSCENISQFKLVCGNSNKNEFHDEIKRIFIFVRKLTIASTTRNAEKNL
jgi:thioredoxin-related protein